MLTTTESQVKAIETVHYCHLCGQPSGGYKGDVKPAGSPYLPGVEFHDICKAELRRGGLD